MTTATATRSRITDRWPTALGLIGAAICVAVMFGTDATGEFAPGIATMMAVYPAAYALGRPAAAAAAAWPAFAVAGVLVVSMTLIGIDAGIGKTVVLALLWIWVLARGLANDQPWFTIETLGLVFFGAVTTAARPLRRCSDHPI